MRKLLGNLLLALAAVATAHTLAQAQTIGLLSMIRGEVKIVRAGQSTPVAARIADLLAAGDRVLTGAGGEAAILFCPESRATKLTANGEAEFSATALQLKKGKLADERKVPNCKLPAALLAGNNKSSGMLRLRGAALVLRTPTRSNVAELKPEFRWDKYENATSYEVKLTDREERILWKQTLTATALPFPADSPALEPGQKYNWRVVAFENNENLADVGTNFTVLPASTASQVRQSEANLLALSKAAPDDSGPLFLLAFLYEDNGMLDAAARTYAQIKARMGEQDWVQGRLNEIMGKLGWDRLESGEAR